jgi:hypothetical protein
LGKRAVLFLIAVLVALAIVSSFLLTEVARLNVELRALKREQSEYWYNSDWVIRSVGNNSVSSAAEAREIYLMLVNRAPRRSYWIIYLPEDNGMPLRLESTEMGSYYSVNGTFRNYAVNCLDARLTIVYNVFKNGTANLEQVKTTCSGYEHQEYP